MTTNPWRAAAGFLIGWLLPPILIAVGVGLLMSQTGPQKGDVVEHVIKALFYGVVVGLPASLAVMVVIVSPTWFFLHRSRAGIGAFVLAGAAIGAVLGLVPLVGPSLTNQVVGPANLALTIALPATVGAFSFLIIRWMAYSAKP
ncbi:MAG: hypothetical protein KXJ53_10795 [Phenylobacterium sp.]|jgi:hypothetical protein|nr:hypothetical protein [Phenylobacterium sp.]